MKTNSKRYHLGLWFHKNDNVVTVDVPGHGEYTYSYHHALYVADADSIEELVERVADLRCLNDMTWKLYRYLILDMRTQKVFEVEAQLDTSQPKTWVVDVRVEHEDGSYAIYSVDRDRHVVEHDSTMVAEIGKDGRYVLREKKND